MSGENGGVVMPQRFELWDISRLKPYDRNPRTHSAEQVAKIAASIAEFGFTNPILVDSEAGIIAGHGRLAAAQSLGMERVPVIELSHLTPAQRRAYVIADNRLALDAGWDDAILAEELRALEADEFDLSLTGFTDDELAGLLADETPANDDEDATPELPVDPVSKPGDVWVLGRHRLRCGDSTSADDVAAVLAGVEPHLMVTDPPYGVDYDPDWRNRADRANGKPYGASAVGEVKNDDRADWREAWALFPGEVAYVWHAGVFAGEVADSLKACEFDLRGQIIWAKHRFAISRGHYHWQHEPCWYAVRKGGTGHWEGDRSQTTLWQIEHNKSETGHGTQKPVEAMRRPILNNSSRGQAVYDPFLGSGTTLIACETTGRVCYGLELDPKYCDVIVKRWQDYTGKRAVLESTGEPFPD